MKNALHLIIRSLLCKCNLPLFFITRIVSNILVAMLDTMNGDKFGVSHEAKINILDNIELGDLIHSIFTTSFDQLIKHKVVKIPTVINKFWSLLLCNTEFGDKYFLLRCEYFMFTGLIGVQL